MKFKTLFLPVVVIGSGMILFGCGSKEEPIKPVANEVPAKVDKHPETKKLEAADAAGYDGTAIRKKVDGMLDKTEENNKKLEDLEKDK